MVAPMAEWVEMVRGVVAVVVTVAIALREVSSALCVRVCR
jgi:hypothetical protein